jgi:hypothetical protein
LVLGVDSARIFKIQIDGNKCVCDLQKAIKEVKKPVFDHIATDSLDVWNVSIPINDNKNIATQVNSMRLKEKDLLPELKKMHEIFTDIDEDTLHVAVGHFTGECSTNFACLLQIMCSFADDGQLAKAVEQVGNLGNVTLYIKELNKWTAEDLQLPNNSILSHFTFDDKQPILSSISNIIFPPHMQTLLDS